jgi:rhodanese-related sulfurtransferase
MFSKLFSATVSAVGGHEVRDLTVEQTEAALASGALLVDLRETAERLREGCIPGAVHLPSGRLAAAAEAGELAPDRAVVLHCAMGGRSAQGVVLLKRLGYREVSHLGGGMRAWKAAGRPIEPG